MRKYGRKSTLAGIAAAGIILLAGMSQAVRAGEAAGISEEDYAAYGGIWYLQTMEESGGAKYNASDIGMKMSFTLNEDGSILFETPSGNQEGTWEMDGEELILTVDGDAISLQAADGKLQGEDGGMTLSFGRDEGGENAFVPPVPTEAASIEDFNGTWKATVVEAWGMVMEIGGAMADMETMDLLVGMKNQDIIIENGVADIFGKGEKETFAFEEGRLQILSEPLAGIEEGLLDEIITLCEDGSIYYQTLGMKFYCDAPDKEEDLPEGTDVPVHLAETERTETEPSAVSAETERTETEPSAVSAETEHTETEPSAVSAETERTETEPSAVSAETERTETEPAAVPAETEPTVSLAETELKEADLTVSLTETEHTETESAIPAVTITEAGTDGRGTGTSLTSSGVISLISGDSGQTAGAAANGSGTQAQAGSAYVCTKVSVKDYEMDPTVLGGEYSVLFRDDGTADLTIAGEHLTGLSWSQSGSSAIVKCSDGTELAFAKTQGGYLLNYQNVMMLLFS